MGAVGFGDQSGGAVRVPPGNRLLRLLYNIERTTLGPVAGIAEEVVSRQQGYPPTSYLDALQSGFKEAKTFDSMVENPWLAFALNVGADPTTWIPGAALAKGGKVATSILGVEKVKNYAMSIERIDRMHSAFGKRFLGPHFELRKRNPQEVRDMLIQRNIDVDDYMSQFVTDMTEFVAKNTANDEEAFRLSRLLLQRQPGRTLQESIDRWGPEYFEEYRKLSDGGKNAYRIAWEHTRAQEAILASREMRAMDAYETLKDRIADRYKQLVATPHQLAANEMKLDEVLKGLDEATVRAVVDKLTPAKAVQEVINLTPNIGKQYHSLATLAVKAGSLKNFRSAIHALPENAYERTVVKNIERDSAIKFLRGVNDLFKADGADDAQAAWRVMQRINTPKTHERKMWAKISSKKKPTVSEVQKAVDRLPLSTEYNSIEDFYRKTRAATDVGDETLMETLKNLQMSMPQELKATMSIPDIHRARAEILGMRGAEGEEAQREVWDALSKHRFEGLPLNVIRQGNIDTIAKINLNQVEIRMAEMLKAEGIAVARAIGNDNLHRNLFQWVKDKGLIIPAEDFRDLKKRTEYFKNLKKSLGDKEFAMRQREGFGEVTKHPIFAGMAMPKSLAEAINSYTTIAGDPAKLERFFGVFGKYQAVWKAMTLAYFPSYHFRNTISNLWNNYLAGMGQNPLDWQHYWRAHEIQAVMNQAKKTGKFGGGLSPEDAELIRNLRRGVTGGEYAGELGRIMDRSNPFKHGFSTEHVSNVFKPGWAFGRYAEDNARIAHYLWARNSKGMSHLEAVKSVNKYLFDYKGGLTKFEDVWFRNGIFPFYAWTRFNLPLQLEILAMQPGKFVNTAKLKDAIEAQWGGPSPDETFQADWFKRAFNIRVRYNPQTGTYEYFFLDTWLPAADINKILDPAAGREAFVALLTPGKIPFEIAFNFNTFTKRRIEEYKGQRKPLHLPSGKTLELPAKIDFLARQLRPVNEADRFLDMTTDLSSEARWARLFIGRSYPYNPQEQVQWWLWKINTQLRELKGAQARAIEKGREGEALRIQKMIDDLQELQDFYE